MKLERPMDVPVQALSPRARSLAPREHGAYGQLAVPMAAALAGGRPGPVALLLAASAWAFFLAHEPALVLLGRRGERARTEQRRRAMSRLLALGLAGVALGGTGLLLASPSVRWAALASAVLALGFGAVVRLGGERSALGEMLASIALAGAAFPVALAAGLPEDAAARAWLVWSIGLAAVVLPVRSIGARRRGSASLVSRLLPAAVALGLGLALQGRTLTRLDLAALAPLVLTSAWLGLARPDPRHLRRVGWSMVVATLVTGAVLVLAVRVGA